MASTARRLFRDRWRIAITVAGLLGSFALFQFTELDLWVQDHFYDFQTRAWWMDKKAAFPRMVFYTGPKVVIIAIGVVLLTLACLPKSRQPRGLPPSWTRDRLWCAVICLALIPGLIGWLKSRSDLECPWALERYGGVQPYLHFFDPLPQGVKPDCGNCFPAGHASGGFALMGLGLLYDDSRRRWLAYSLGFLTGWAMGSYQMLKGAHFLSHTLTTMLLAILIVQIIGQVIGSDRRLAAATHT